MLRSLSAYSDWSHDITRTNNVKRRDERSAVILPPVAASEESSLLYFCFVFQNRLGRRCRYWLEGGDSEVVRGSAPKKGPGVGL